MKIFIIIIAVIVGLVSFYFVLKGLYIALFYKNMIKQHYIEELNKEVGFKTVIPNFKKVSNKEFVEAEIRAGKVNNIIELYYLIEIELTDGTIVAIKNLITTMDKNS